MFLHSSRLRSSPTDLANFLACRHKTALDLAVARGESRRPDWADPLVDVLRQRGQEHEAVYVASLRASGLRVVDLTRPEGAPRLSDAEAVGRTLTAMREGADVIVQAALGTTSGNEAAWFGYADILRRVEGTSALGPWHYEAHDTKLATETKGGTILQLSLYSELLGALQGRIPSHFVVVTPAAAERYDVDDFAAFFRLVRAQYLAFVQAPTAVYPHPADHCDVCVWWDGCNARRRADDHLSFVAGLGRTQQAELESRAVPTLKTLAHLDLPLAWKPRRGARETYERLREQARVQFQQRDSRSLVYELLEVEPRFGLCRLPAPCTGDLFLDLEGDPFGRRAVGADGARLMGAGESGREYLFGLGWQDEQGGFTYRSWWATSDQEERAAFEELIDVLSEACTRDSGVHIYHYAPYEPAAMKRLMGRYATREVEVDALLRGGRFVDLFAVVREALRAGVESYSIKKLEPFYGFVRDVALQRAGDERRLVELALESGDVSGITDSIRATVEGYNRDDVRSTAELRGWLEALRHECVTSGRDVPRFVSPESDASPGVTDRQQRIEALRARLLPLGGAAPLLAYLLDWHYREDKVAWWEYFRLLGMPEEDLADEGAAISDLVFVGTVREVVGKNGRPTGSEIHRYTFPAQEMEIRPGSELHRRDGTKFGEVEAVNRGDRTIDIKRGRTDLKQPHPTAVFAHERVSPDIPAGALFRLGEAVAQEGFDLDGPHAPALNLLLRRGSPLLAAGHPMSGGDLATILAPQLARSILPIQGPPGAGKTFTGARMICELVRAGKRVGITATGHKVIRGLLEAVAERAAREGVPVRLGHKPKEVESNDSTIVEFAGNPEVLEALQSGTVNVMGGTAWLWAREEFAGVVDVLFVDEAGQMSLANVLAVSQAATSVVLLGDPQQLEQPQKGSHPDGVGVSALQHVLGAHQTMPADLGIFLERTWRLAPAICAFTSEVFYDGKLESKPGLEAQQIEGSRRFAGAGLRVVEVPHEGCRNASDEEVQAVEEVVADLLTPGVQWRDEHGAPHPLKPSDILVVAPYNAHVVRLHERLAPRGIGVGTVDKFQGQEAPVVIYSMATSRPEDAPRGMEFLYSLNRLNVATSRAKCISVLVASPRLFEPECRTPRQMHLANALCRYRELAIK